MLRPFAFVCKTLEHSEASLTNEEYTPGSVLHASDCDIRATPSQFTRLGLRYLWRDLEIDKEPHSCKLNFRNASLPILGTKSN